MSKIIVGIKRGQCLLTDKQPIMYIGGSLREKAIDLIKSNKLHLSRVTASTKGLEKDWADMGHAHDLPVKRYKQILKTVERMKTNNYGKKGIEESP